ncbi:MAG TPA: hypothetical protein VFV92_13990, partial [Candidatus Bathyarchaeia archaeon]|nr:hypothetical protein [Candidatus Bathyarchaeia archaeon]
MSLGTEESQRLSRTLHRTFQVLYLQFAFYWATIAAGMFVNYYYSVPETVDPNFPSIFAEFFNSPSLFAHVLFAVLSTSMSIPVIILARRVGLKQVALLHAGAITARMVGFVTGPLFMYYATSAVGDDYSAGVMTFIMASVFI